jgi:hypothetical protein
MSIQRFLPIAAAVLLGGCASGYTYRSGDGSGDYYYGEPRVEYRYHTPSGVYGGYGPYGPYGYYGGYYGGGYYGAWDPYRSHYYYPGTRYYYGPYSHGPYGYRHGYPHGYTVPRQYVVPRHPRTGRPHTNPGGPSPQAGVIPPPLPPPPPSQPLPTPRSQGNAAEGRTERAKIKREGREE